MNPINLLKQQASKDLARRTQARLATAGPIISLAARHRAADFACQ